MSIRLKRLAADYEQVQGQFLQHPRIRLVSALGTPPEQYVFEFTVRGLVPSPDGGIQEAATHRAEIFLPLDYPRRPPFCRMLTPVFHPNISPQKICIGDHWSAGETLASLVVRIAEMICFQSYNQKSPLNPHAAVWVEEHHAALPLEAGDLWNRMNRMRADTNREVS